MKATTWPRRMITLTGATMCGWSARPRARAAAAFFFHAFSRATNAHAGTLRLEIEGKRGEFFYDRMLSLNGRFHILHNAVNKKTGEVDVIAQAYELPAFTPIGPPVTIAHIPFDPRSLEMTTGFRSRIETSEDGEHVILFFDRIKSKEDEQLILVFAMDADLNARWKQAYRIPFQADRIGTYGVKVSDQGIVYALMRSRFANRAIKNKSVNFSFELFGLAQEGMAAQPVDLPGGMAALSAGLAMQQGRPVVAGFHVEPHHTTKETAGYFVSTFDPALGAAPETRTQAFPQVLDERVWDLELIKRQDGGLYLSGGAQQQVTNRIWDHFIATVAMDKTGAHEWDVVVPRRVYNIEYGEMGYAAMEGKDHLVLVFREPPQNLERYLNGEEPKAVMTWNRVTVCAAIDGQGRIHYRELSDEGLDFKHSHFLRWAETAPYEQAAFGQKKIGKKEVDGAVIATFH